MILTRSALAGLATLLAGLAGSLTASTENLGAAGSRMGSLSPDMFALGAVAKAAPARAKAAAPVEPRNVRPARVDAEGLVDRWGGIVSSGRVTLFVPPNAVSEPTTFWIAESRRLPGAFPKGVKATSACVSLTKSRAGSFAVPVRVTMPCSDATSQAFYWEVSRKKYEAVTTLACDARSITFKTAHFTDFVAGTRENSVTGSTRAPRSPYAENDSGLSMDELEGRVREQLEGGDLSLDTGFDPARDGVPFVNMGDHDNNGNCFGMANVAVWYYGERVRRDAEARDGGEYTSYASGLSETFNGSEASLHAWVRSAQDDGDNEGRRNYQSIWSGWSGPDYDGMRREGRELLTRMAATNSPQTLSIMDGSSGHVVVVFGYENGHFLVYDPNFPGETMFYEFDGHDFGDFTHADGSVVRSGIYDSIDGIEAHQLSDSFSDEDMRDLLDRSTTHGAQERYVTVVTDSVTRNADGTATVTGRVAGFEDAFEHADRIEIVLPGTGGLIVHAAIRDGRFTVTVPEGWNGTFVVNATEDGGSYTGSTQVEIPAPPPPPPRPIEGTRKGMLNKLGEKVVAEVM
ncbi:MAG: hypothetical protein ACAI25_17930 [Planctomycetota bacterium]